MYLLDTNVISELRRPRPHGAVIAWLQGVADEDLHLSPITLGELQAGVELTREQDPNKAASATSRSDAWFPLGGWLGAARASLLEVSTFEDGRKTRRNRQRLRARNREGHRGCR
jgi:hypothetical protein